MGTLLALLLLSQGYATGFDDRTCWLPGGDWKVAEGVARMAGEEGSLFSPLVPLTGLERPTLSFRCVGRTPDRRQIAIIPAFPHEIIEERCTSTEVWHRHTIPLDPKWEFVQIAFIAESPSGGWAIDDFEVGERWPPLAPWVAGSLVVLAFLVLARM